MLSRAADNLYWMSRYLERAETTARLIYNHFNLMLEESMAADRHWQRLFTALNLPVPVSDADGFTDPAYQRIALLTHDRDNDSSILSCIATAENARQVREQVSIEMWEQINRLFLELKDASLDAVWQTQPHEFFREIENNICLFRGITASTMYHSEGWGFIQIGLHLERILLSVRLLDAYLNDNGETAHPRTDDYLRWLGLLRSMLAFEAYCRTYTPTVLPRNVAEFTILNEGLPRSLRFGADRLQAGLQQLAAGPTSRREQHLHRLVGRLQARLRYGQIDEILDADLHTYLTDVADRRSQIHEALYQSYIDYTIEEELAA